MRARSSWARASEGFIAYRPGFTAPMHSSGCVAMDARKSAATLDTGRRLKSQLHQGIGAVSTRYIGALQNVSSAKWTIHGTTQPPDALVQHTRRQDGCDSPGVAAVAVQQARVLTETRSLQACELPASRTASRGDKICEFCQHAYDTCMPRV